MTPQAPEEFRDAGWLILGRDGATLEFFSFPQLDPATSWFSCCLRLDGSLLRLVANP